MISRRVLFPTPRRFENLPGGWAASSISGEYAEPIEGVLCSSAEPQLRDQRIGAKVVESLLLNVGIGARGCPRP